MCMMMAGLLGGLVSGIGAAQQQHAQADAYRRQAQEQRTQAQLDQRQASAEQIAGQQQQRRMGEKGDQLAATQITGYAGAGGVALSGSALDTIIDSRRESMLDIGAIKYNTDIKSDNQMWKARQSATNANDADAAAEKADSSAGLAFLTPLIGSFSKLGGAF